MNTIPKDQQPELIAAARIAQAGDGESPWTRIADFFEKQRKQAEEVIEPRAAAKNNRRETPNK